MSHLSDIVKHSYIADYIDTICRDAVIRVSQRKCAERSPRVQEMNRDTGEMRVIPDRGAGQPHPSGLLFSILGKVLYPFFGV